VPRILALFLLLYGTCACAEESCDSPFCNSISARTFFARVIAVMDGDTVLVLHNGHPEKIRLADIDAPEKAQNFGMESKQSLAEMTLHKRIQVTMLTVDKYGRTVALLASNNLNINEEQVRRGMAWDYSYFHNGGHYAALQDEARRAKRGLWSRTNPMRPWQWRKAHTDASPPPHILGEQDFNCGSKHRCSQMRTCDEAFFYLVRCGEKSLNPDGDGVPCKDLCLRP
jgi:endonuclease YncB( thermonuclease family)